MVTMVTAIVTGVLITDPEGKSIVRIVGDEQLSFGELRLLRFLALLG